MLKISKITAAVALLALGASAQASFVIDNFSMNQNAPPGVLSDNTVTAAPGTTSTAGVRSHRTGALLE